MQTLKDEVRRAIVEAAGVEFARQEYARISMATIARRAGISVGNIYRYFPDKARLLREVIKPSFVRECRALLRARVHAAFGQTTPVADPIFEEVGHEMTDWVLRHRVPLIILLRYAEGTPYEKFPREMVLYLVKLARDYAKSIGIISLGMERERALRLIYAALVENFATLLADVEEERHFRETLKAYQSYHLNGLKGFFHD